MALYLVKFLTTEYELYEKPVEKKKTLLVKAPDKDCVKLMIECQYELDNGPDFVTVDIESIEKCLDWEDFNK